MLKKFFAVVVCIAIVCSTVPQSVLTALSKDKTEFPNDAIISCAGQSPDAIHELDMDITSTATISFNYVSLTARDTLIGLGCNSEIITSDNYFLASGICIMDCDGKLFCRTSQYHIGSQRLEAVDQYICEVVKNDVYKFVINIDVENEMYSVTVTDSDGKINMCKNIQFRNATDVIDCLVLLDTSYDESSYITDFNIEYDPDDDVLIVPVDPDNENILSEESYIIEAGNSLHIYAQTPFETTEDYYYVEWRTDDADIVSFENGSSKDDYRWNVGNAVDNDVCKSNVIYAHKPGKAQITFKVKGEGCFVWNITVTPKKGSGFNIREDGWSFANSEWSFSGKVERNEYTMPLEIYEQVYGRSYINANNITTGELFRGFCEGMSDTAVLFYDGLLNWKAVDDSYNDDFENVNDYYYSIGYYRPTKFEPKYYYVTSNPDTEVTRLIECYQLWGNHMGAQSSSSTFDNVDRTFFTKVPDDSHNNESGVVFETYKHLNYEDGGTYVEDTLNKIKQAVSANTPMTIGLNYQGGGHAVVARTDKAPEDEGNGWWKVFVYDPNKPYINDDILDIISNADNNYKILQSHCNEILNNGEDIYMELNPKRNLWRYNSSLTSEYSEQLRGYDESENKIKIMTYTKERDNITYSVSHPEFFYIMNPKDYYAGTFKDPNRSWLPTSNDDVMVVPLSNQANAKIYSVDNELLVAVCDGVAVSLSKDIKYYPYLNSNSKNQGANGKLVLPKDKYYIEIDDGTLNIWGQDNVIHLNTTIAVSALIDIEKNKIDLTSHGNGDVELLLSNVGGADEYDTYKITGDLEDEEQISIAFPDNHELQTDNTDSMVIEYKTDKESKDNSHVSFSDVNRNQNFYTAVTYLAENGILTGYPDGTFRPYDKLTRAEMAAIMVRMLGLTDRVVLGKTSFTDVPAGNWAAGYINVAEDEGIINGMGDGTFAPNASVTYEQAVKMAICTFGHETEAAKRGGYPTGYLSVAASNGITAGVIGTIGQPITRGAVAQLIYNTINAMMADK